MSGGAGAPAHVWVRCPRGDVSTVAMPTGFREVTEAPDHREYALRRHLPVTVRLNIFNNGIDFLGVNTVENQRSND